MVAVRIFILIGLISGMAQAQSPELKISSFVAGDSLHIIFKANNSGTPVALGSSNFAVDIAAPGADAAKVQWKAGKFSNESDPESYREMGFSSGSRLSANVFVKSDGSGKGTLLTNDEAVIAEAVIPVTDPCGTASISWVDAPATVNAFYKSKKGKNLDAKVTKHKPSPVALLDSVWLTRPELKINEGVLNTEWPGAVTWLRNGEIIEGENTAVLVPTGPGVYKVSALNPCGTVMESAGMDLRTTDLPSGTVAGVDVKCFPNPFSASTNVSYTLPTAARVRFSIYSLTGVKMGDDAQTQTAGKQVWVLDTEKSGLSAGVYLLKGYVNNEYAFVKKLIIEK